MFYTSWLPWQHISSNIFVKIFQTFPVNIEVISTRILTTEQKQKKCKILWYFFKTIQHTGNILCIQFSMVRVNIIIDYSEYDISQYCCKMYHMWSLKKSPNDPIWPSVVICKCFYEMRKTVLTRSTGPPDQDQQNFVRTSKFFSFF
jgi:hypothetical protein